MPFRFTKFVLLLLLALPSQALADDDQPKWISHAPKADASHRFYVGRSSNAPDEATAFKEATSDAIEQAIKENFGFATQVQTDSYEAVSAATVTKRLSELSDQVRLEGFEQQDFHKEVGENGKTSVWVLYRYSQRSIVKEKERLASEAKQQRPTEFSVIGDVSKAASGVLEVSSTPQGATVTVDHEAYGRTPLRVIGQLPIGEHLLRIEHPNYEAIEEQIIINSSRTTKVNKVLLRSSGVLKVTTTPSNATVQIGGKLELSPTNELRLPAGVKHEIVITHPDAERYSQTIEVGANEQKNLDIKLPLKPAHISVNSIPSGADVAIDAKRYTTPTGFVPVDAGKDLKIELSKAGYEPSTAMATVRGGQRKAIPTIRLVSFSDAERARIKQEKDDARKDQGELNRAADRSLLIPMPYTLFLQEIGGERTHITSRLFKDGSSKDVNHFYVGWFVEKSFGFIGLKASLRVFSKSENIFGGAGTIGLPFYYDLQPLMVSRAARPKLLGFNIGTEQSGKQIVFTPEAGQRKLVVKERGEEAQVFQKRFGGSIAYRYNRAHVGFGLEFNGYHHSVSTDDIDAGESYGVAISWFMRL